jgi:hypothetical protein
MLSKINSHSKNKLLIYFLIYLSFITSFILGENSSGGSQNDSLAMQMYIDQLLVNFKQGIVLFFEEGQGHSPVFYIMKSVLENFFTKIGSDLINLTLGFLIPIVFYSILKKKFIGCSKDLLFLISLILYLSPYIRSSAVWATNDNLATLFFALSISKFFTFKKNYDKAKDIFLCFFYIILAAYIRQYYIMIILVYFFFLYKNITLKVFISLLAISFILSIPYFLYTYIFLLSNFDYATKGFAKPDLKINLLIFFNMYLFYILPFFLHHENYKVIKFFYNEKKTYLLSLSVIFVLFFFNYNLPDMKLGGGIYYKLFQFLGLDFLFIISAFIGMFLVLLTINLKLKNLFILIIFFMMLPFATIYQKYYDPFLVIFFFSFLQSDLIDISIKNKAINIPVMFIYFLLFLTASNIYYLNL